MSLVTLWTMASDSTALSRMRYIRSTSSCTQEDVNMGRRENGFQYILISSLGSTASCDGPSTPPGVGQSRLADPVHLGLVPLAQHLAAQVIPLCK